MLEDPNFKKSYIVGLDGFTYADLERAYASFLSKEYNNESHVVIDGIEKFQLTKSDALHILAYTGHSSMWINAKIRENNLDRNCNIFIKNLDRALDKIPPANNIKLFHMTNDLWEGMIEGSIIKIPNYLSTSIEDYKNSEVVLKLQTARKGSKARDISTISNNKYELEYLFLRGASFRVLRIEKIGKITYVELVEYANMV
ncbi:ADP-ribosyltransferase [Belliella pelovolcani]|uniref:ADP-ribosyltransferase exoenzyme n=1 Tax=Belliella pelovolcani TaxID=529505 RepID=A0A1N7Q2R3_9BACT|nr:ADP-ribosyltransferase [Belliella pelovolcani]SIT17115.1 ADP-ribosyltransferase exoenzyme [Belliella pelovolcani]